MWLDGHQEDCSQGIKPSFHTPHLHLRGRFWKGRASAHPYTAQAVDFTPALCSAAACLYCSQLLGLQRKTSETEVAAPIFLTLSSPFQPQGHAPTGFFAYRNTLSQFGPASFSACTTLRGNGTELFPPFAEALIILPLPTKPPNLCK